MTRDPQVRPLRCRYRPQERTEAMLTATIIFTVLVAAWGRTATLVERRRSPQARSPRSVA